MKKNVIILSMLIGLFTSVGAKEIETYQTWTALMFNTYSYESFSHKLYFEAWNDSDDGMYLWLVSNKFGYKLDKNWSFALNYTFLDIQGGNKKNPASPHQNRIEIETTNSIELFSKMSVRYRLENRWRPQAEPTFWDYRLRIKPSVDLPVFEAKSPFGLYMDAEFMFANEKLAKVATDISDSYNECRWGLIGFSYKANDNVSFKLSPAIKFSKSKTDVWSKSGILNILLINKF